MIFCFLVDGFARVTRVQLSELESRRREDESSRVVLPHKLSLSRERKSRDTTVIPSRNRPALPRITPRAN